jgi:putative lipoprotein
MLKYVATAVAALVVLGGCNSSNQPAGTQAPASNGSQSAQQASAEIPGTVTGSVSLREPMEISADAKLSVKLVDVAMQDIVIAEIDQPVSGQPPYQFSLTLDPAKIDRSRTYVLNTLLFDGDRRFVPALQFPVLTAGAGAHADIVLNAEATPGEKLKAEVSRLKSNIGGMKRIQDSFLDGDLSVAWDGFVEPGSKVRFVRVNSEKGEGDTAVRSNVEYAFLDDKPMGIFKKAGGIRVGWDENGNVILNEKAGGGAVDDNDAKSFYNDAAKVLTMAQAKLPKK